MLSAHPSILAIPYETHAFAPTLYSDDPDPEAPFEPWRLAWALAEQGIPERSLRWCEKTPKNVITFGRLLSYFDEEVRLLHIVRDGRDVVTSRHPGGEGTQYYVEPERWVQDVAAGLKHRDHPCVHTLKYEDLVRVPSETLEELGRFLDEDLTSIGGDWVEKATVQHFGPHKRRVARPLNDSSIGRWKDPEHADRVKQLLNTEGAARLLSELEYDPT